MGEEIDTEQEWMVEEIDTELNGWVRRYIQS